MAAERFVAHEDKELIRWLLAAFAHGGDFLKRLSEAALRADAENYPVLRPVIRTMADKYPKYFDPAFFPPEDFRL